MKDGLYREEAMKKLSSPEQLNEYIRVTNPGVWITLLAVIILLLGVCVWGVLGRLTTTVDAVAVQGGEGITCYLKDTGTLTVSEGDTFSVDDTEYTVFSVSEEAKKASDCPLLTERARYLGGIAEDDWVYEISASGALEDGAPHAVKIVTESVSPLSFVFN